MISVVNYVSKDHIMLDEHIEFTINIKNTSNFSLSNVIFYNNLLEEVEIEKRSLKINGNETHIHHWEKSLFLGDLNLNDECKISFRARVRNSSLSTTIKNIAKVKFSYIEDNIKKIGSKDSNAIQLKIANPEITINTEASIDSNNEIVYTTNIINTGKLNIKDIIFTDILPFNLSLVENSVYINDVLVDNPDISYLMLIDINVGENVKVIFRANINEYSHLEMRNIVILYFNYELEDGSLGHASSKPVENRLRSSYSYSVKPIEDHKRMI